MFASTLTVRPRVASALMHAGICEPEITNTPSQKSAPSALHEELQSAWNSFSQVLNCLSWQVV
jgi:hypothetical protein